MKRYILLLLIIIGISINSIQSSFAWNEFWPVWTTFIWMYWHSYSVVDKWWEVWLHCANWASKCLENCGWWGGWWGWGGWDPDPVITTDSYWDSCSYIHHWVDNWSDCNMISNWNKCISSCQQINTWAPVYRTESWSCTRTYTDWVLTNTSCDWSCYSNAWKPANVTKIKTTTLPWCTDNSTCWNVDWRLFSYTELDWPTDKVFCAEGNSSPVTPVFPGILSSTSWICSNWTTSANCSASRWGMYCWDWVKQSPNSLWVKEDCDDGNNVDNDLCPNDCDFWWIITYCGDWVKQTPNGLWVKEDCDDGNNQNWDWCSASCMNESCVWPSCWGGPVLKYCWDWIKQIPNSFWLNESCDDGNNLSSDWCSASCMIETCTWWTCVWWGVCWDWIKQATESCDDGNKIDWDACTNVCTAWWDPEDKICGNWITEAPNYNWFMEECDDWDTNSDNACTNNCTWPHTSQPWELSISATSDCKIDNSVFANNIEENVIYARITVQWWIEDPTNKKVINLWTPTDFIDLSNNLSDRVNNKWDSSLTFTWIPINWVVWDSSRVLPIAKVKSITPFVSCWNKLSFKLNWKTIILTDVWYNFKKPYVWRLEATLDNWVTWDAKPSLWTELRYRLIASPRSNFTNYALWLSVNKISYYGPNITLQNTELLTYSWTWPREFETRVNSSSVASELNRNPWLQVNLPIISYSVDWKIVKYYLSTYENGSDRTPIRITWEDFLWVKVIGLLQGAWKSDFTWQWENISNLYTTNQRTEIRKRAYDYTMNMNSWEIRNNVKYVEWNITITWNLDSLWDDISEYETLIIKDWNLIIDWNLNPWDRKLWIIILKDNYDVNNWYNQWNVFVTNDTITINAMIYADGWFISADSFGNPYTSDSTARTYNLQSQLTLNGTLFTRNTIWWAQYYGWYYTLPGWSKINDFDRAMVYDLNYIRRWNTWCDKNVNWNCNDIGEIKEWFIIRYDSRIQTDPPKLFTK